jgi:hypothetical protein
MARSVMAMVRMSDQIVRFASPARSPPCATMRRQAERLM